MGRNKTIDRERVLAAAETLVAEQGASALTIGNVAKAAGITKGGVQSCFGSKEALIAAMLKRWMDDYDRRFVNCAPNTGSPLDAVLAHIVTTKTGDEESQTRAAGLLAVLLQHPDHLTDTRRWYRERMRGLEDESPASRQARLAFLATEGAFFLRFFGLLPIPQREWNAIFDDIEALMPHN